MTNTTSSPIADAFAEVHAINETVDRPAPKTKRKTASKPKSPKSTKGKAPAKKSPAPKAKSKPKASPKPKRPAAPKEARVLKRDQFIAMLRREDGASVEELQTLGLQAHSVRGLISTLKSKHGLTINRDKETGRYSTPSE